MDVSSVAGIANLSTSLSSGKIASDVQVEVLKKAMNIEAQAAASLVQSIPSSPSGQGMPENWGGKLSVMA